MPACLGTVSNDVLYDAIQHPIRNSVRQPSSVLMALGFPMIQTDTVIWVTAESPSSGQSDSVGEDSRGLRKGTGK